MADDDTLCKICQIHFSNAETLAKHCAVIHSKEKNSEEFGSKRLARQPSAQLNEAPEPSAAVGQKGSENVELSPLLAVLSDAQKDAILLRAVQRDPEFFYDRILEQASTPLTDQAADARLDSMDPEAVAAAVRWFGSIDLPGNALSLLVAASQRCLSALEELAESQAEESKPPAQSVVDGGDDDDGDGDDATPTGSDKLHAAVEALPAAGTIGALWVYLLRKPSVRSLLGTDERAPLRLLMEGLRAAAATVRGFAAAVLVGPNGEKIELLDDALESIDDPGSGIQTGKRQKKV